MRITRNANLFWDKFTQHIDDYLPSITFGIFTVLVIAQFFSLNPIVRARLDTLEGRFVSQPVNVVPNSVLSDVAHLSLNISPNKSYPNIYIELNGEYVANFTKPSITLSVHEGDNLTLQSNGQQIVYVTVDQNDPYLFMPAPGMVFKLDSRHPSVKLPSAAFTK